MDRAITIQIVQFVLLMHRTNRILGLEILKDTRSWIKGHRTTRGLGELTNKDQIKR